MENTYLPESTIGQLSPGRLVFIDPRVEAYQSLAAGVLPDTEVIILGADQDGVEQISQVLRTRTGNVNSLHIVSHGAPGCVYLGSTELSQQSLNRYAEQLMDWAEALTTDAQVLLYGCEVARTDAGKAFVQRLSELTGANMAASDDRTGSTAKGGDWELEVRIGSTPASLAFVPAALEAYTAVLAEPYLVKDINPGTGSSLLSSLTKVENTLYFTTNNGTSDKRQLWKSDGTSTGTVLVKDFLPGSDTEFFNDIQNLTSVNGILYFTAYNTSKGTELWKSDGTTKGTVLLKDTNPGSDSSFFQYLLNANGTLYFIAKYTGEFDPYDGYGLWKSDGTTKGTVLVKDLGSSSDRLFTYRPSNIGSTVYFANISSEGEELWKSDGTAKGTVLVKDINPGPNTSLPYNFTDINGILYFAADDGINGSELWKSDGTAAGTVLVKDIIPGPGSSSPSGFTDVNGTLYFTVSSTEDNKAALWKTDGTAAGTVLVKIINPGIFYSNIYNLTKANGTLYFVANDGFTGSELWKSDGTAAGTVLVKDIKPEEDDPTYGGSNPTNLLNVNGTLYFTADDGINGRELWKSDGTAAGTVLLKDINPGSASSDISELTIINDTLYFTADDGTNGKELWALKIDPSPYIVGITATDANAKEASNDPGIFRISRSGDGDISSALTVNYTISGSATNGSDYNNLSGSATIAAEQTFVDITITPISDSLLEGSETVTLSLADTADYDLKTSNTYATVTIADDNSKFNIINGTIGRDTLTGTNNNDAITGSEGKDILTGGAGSDQFLYNSIRDARDTITDFVAGTDKIVFTQLFESLSLGNLDYSGAVAGGYLSFGTAGSNTTVLIDLDGSEGRARSITLLTGQGVAQATLANANNFLF